MSEGLYWYDWQELTLPQLERELSKRFDPYETFLAFVDAVSGPVWIGGDMRFEPSRILRGLVATGDLTEEDVLGAAIDMYVDASVMGTRPRGRMPRELNGVFIRHAPYTPRGPRPESRSVRGRTAAKPKAPTKKAKPKTKGARL